MKKIYLCLLVLILNIGCEKKDPISLTLPSELNFEGTIQSCSDFSVSQALNSENHGVWINIHGSGREELKLTDEFKTFEIPNIDLKTKIYLFDSMAGASFCTDVISDNEPKIIGVWNAISGNIKIKISDLLETENETYYRITLILENVEYLNVDTGEKRIIENFTINEALAGWYPG
ncbi:hypothetical protein [Aureivirga sp. CE67]|uniref:hypothetical protein n=1 Tax=Aureivirga sp. CE67 TaxID=1788983 RepID=UPI0018C95F97|nr:hypothetical protein [Aureivirga sp. CE67]